MLENIDILKENRQILADKTSQNNEKAKKWKRRPIGLTKTMAENSYLARAFFKGFETATTKISNFSSKEGEINLAWHRRVFFSVERSF